MKYLIGLFIIGTALAASDLNPLFKPLTKNAPFLLKREVEKALKEVKSSGSQLESSMAWVNLNHDDHKDLCLSLAHPFFGQAAGQITCYLAKDSSSFVEVIKVNNVMPEKVNVSNNLTQGHYDLTFSGPGMSPPKIWKWNGIRYH